MGRSIDPAHIVDAEPHRRAIDRQHHKVAARDFFRGPHGEAERDADILRRGA
jgi:hypothetical protein